MPKRLFIIEDDPSILDMLCIIFEDEGYNVQTATNSHASELILSYSPNVVILDIRLEGSPKNGVEICQELKMRHSTQHIPVMLVSAEVQLPALARHCHADAYLQKPFDIHELLQKVACFV